jgi:hypothetical protein
MRREVGQELGLSGRGSESVEEDEQAEQGADAACDDSEDGATAAVGALLVRGAQAKDS